MASDATAAIATGIARRVLASVEAEFGPQIWTRLALAERLGDHRYKVQLGYTFRRKLAKGARKRLRRLRIQRGEAVSLAFLSRFERAGITEQYWHRLVDAFGRACAYCRTTETKLTIDHVPDRHHGGTGGEGAVVPACGSCNSRKQHRGVPWLCLRMGIDEAAFWLRANAAWDACRGSQNLPAS